MQTVKIYKITISKAFSIHEQGESFSLRPWSGDSLYYEGSDDGGKEYILPEGYEVAISSSGTPEIYDSKGRHCDLTKKFNSPCIDGQIMLKKSK